jgi:hypothetical protein
MLFSRFRVKRGKHSGAGEKSRRRYSNALNKSSISIRKSQNNSKNSYPSILTSSATKEEPSHHPLSQKSRPRNKKTQSQKAQKTQKASKTHKKKFFKGTGGQSRSNHQKMSQAASMNAAYENPDYQLKCKSRYEMSESIVKLDYETSSFEDDFYLQGHIYTQIEKKRAQEGKPKRRKKSMTLSTNQKLIKKLINKNPKLKHKLQKKPSKRKIKSRNSLTMRDQEESLHIFKKERRSKARRLSKPRTHESPKRNDQLFANKLRACLKDQEN